MGYVNLSTRGSVKRFSNPINLFLTMEKEIDEQDDYEELQIELQERDAQ